jgi:NAD(P)-dependent dehydrogenase (short-subunit alcohol dehydrogenase family)
MTKTPARISFSEDGAYLLVGGLGGLGRAVAQWMVENGARTLVFLSRTAGVGDNNSKFVYDLELQGCQSLLIQGDVANLADVKRAVTACGKPINGVIHMAMLMKVSHYLSLSLLLKHETNSD